MDPTRGGDSRRWPQARRRVFSPKEPRQLPVGQKLRPPGGARQFAQLSGQIFLMQTARAVEHPLTGGQPIAVSAQGLFQAGKVLLAGGVMPSHLIHENIDFVIKGNAPAIEAMGHDDGNPGPDESPLRPSLLLQGIGAAGRAGGAVFAVEILVAARQIGKSAAESVQEDVLLPSRPQGEPAGKDEVDADLRETGRQRLEIPVPVGEKGEKRHGRHADGTTAPLEGPQSFEALFHRACQRLEDGPQPIVEGHERNHEQKTGLSVDLRPQIEIAFDEARFGQNRHRKTAVGQNASTRRHQPLVGLGGLISVADP
jgi:hypothetical protein